MPTQGLKQSIARTPDFVAISNEYSAQTFRELGQTIERLVKHLRSSNGTRVLASVLPSGPEFTALFFACLETGTVFVPLPDNLSPEGSARYLRKVRADLVVATTLADLDVTPWTDLGAQPIEFAGLLNGSAQLAQPQSPQWAQACCLVQFTSGSTGQPKALLVQAEQLTANLRQSADHLEALLGQPLFCATPQFHAMGLAAVHEHLSSGSAVHIASAFNPAADISRMTKFGCAALLASPTYCKLMLSLSLINEASLGSLQTITLGSASTSAQLVDDLRRAFPSAHIHIRYGLSEAVGTLARLTMRPGERLATAGGIGRALHGVEIQVRDGGELFTRAASCVRQLLLEGGQTRSLLGSDGFLATGDLVELDSQRRLSLKGRKSAMIKCGGFRIHPAEIEEYLCTLPGVQEAVVLGVPDPMLEQQLVACIGSEPEADQAKPLELRELCRKILGPNKTPARFQIFTTLPQTPAGKPDRTELLRQATTQTPAGLSG